ncbi:hypothetical protein B0H19DRAFT_1258359 [Mycena capillaripes]|nr:hypothetical protein B0H19DRAFT_1258359 [Mycena capillaripes]
MASIILGTKLTLRAYHPSSTAVTRQRDVDGTDGVKNGRRSPVPFDGTDGWELYLWGVLKDTIPGFSEEMIGLAGQRKLRKHVCSEVQEGLRGARGDDTNSLKHAIANYVTLPAPAAPEAAEDSDDAPPPPPPPPKFNSNTKVDRGYNNPYSARANTPVKYPATEETYASIRNGEIHVSGTDMPYFMYRDGYVYNSDDREDGLLEGSTMFAASKHIYQGPSVALKQDGYTRGKAGNAALNGVTALTARDIAYVGVQTRFALSSQQNWGHMDGGFSYLDFYWSIVDLLQGEEGQEIIDRFNLKVFGTKSSANQSTAAAPAGPSDFEILEAQRAAKRARKIADATAAASASV